MKESIYNIYVPLENKKYILFNSLNGSILIIDDELRNYLKNECKLMKLDPELMCRLNELGMVVSKNIDERKIFDYKYLHKKYTTQAVHFSILLTYECNLSCPYCYEHTNNKKLKAIDTNIFKDIIKLIKNYVTEIDCSKLSITFYGGEPLNDHKNLFEILRTLSQWCLSKNIEFKSALITNGTLINENIALKLSHYISAVQLTLDGPRWYHDGKRMFKNGRGTYDKILESVDFLRKVDIPVYLRVQVSKENIQYLSELFEDLSLRGFNENAGVRCYVSPIMNLNSACSSYVSLCIEEDFYAEILPRIWEEGLKYGFIMASKPLPVFIQPYCSFVAYSSYLVDCYGDVYKCVSMVGQGCHKVAHVNHEGKFENITSELINFITRDPLRICECNKCVYIPTCSGGCAYRSLIKNQTQDCSLHKSLEEKKILFYLKAKYPKKFGEGFDEIF